MAMSSSRSASAVKHLQKAWKSDTIRSNSFPDQELSVISHSNVPGPAKAGRKTKVDAVVLYGLDIATQYDIDLEKDLANFNVFENRITHILESLMAVAKQRVPCMSAKVRIFLTGLKDLKVLTKVITKWVLVQVQEILGANYWAIDNIPKAGLSCETTLGGCYLMVAKANDSSSKKVAKPVVIYIGVGMSSSGLKGRARKHFNPRYRKYNGSKKFYRYISGAVDGTARINLAIIALCVLSSRADAEKPAFGVISDLIEAYFCILLGSLAEENDVPHVHEFVKYRNMCSEDIFCADSVIGANRICPTESIRLHTQGSGRQNGVAQKTKGVDDKSHLAIAAMRRYNCGNRYEEFVSPNIARRPGIKEAKIFAYFDNGCKIGLHMDLLRYLRVTEEIELTITVNHGGIAKCLSIMEAMEGRMQYPIPPNRVPPKTNDERKPTEFDVPILVGGIRTSPALSPHFTNLTIDDVAHGQSFAAAEVCTCDIEWYKCVVYKHDNAVGLQKAVTLPDNLFVTTEGLEIDRSGRAIDNGQDPGYTWVDLVGMAILDIGAPATPNQIINQVTRSWSYFVPNAPDAIFPDNWEANIRKALARAINGFVKPDRGATSRSTVGAAWENDAWSFRLGKLDYYQKPTVRKNKKPFDLVGKPRPKNQKKKNDGDDVDVPALKKLKK
ncbi:hypothetical protein BOTCAL_0082g00240 [Botryotinia calthae]|uniref:Fork-head domain-containing protein n=1 Tax=Botryotinia calthae TaxID=38488 RepID=A0A4Y8DAC1_9HELO|nr:hypothetical protein BOTCAL_0082g00240 [Botryotinia calthae]